MTSDYFVAATSVATVVLTGGAIVATLRGVKNQLWLQTFAEYTRRYAEIVKDLPSESRRPDGNFKLDELQKDQREAVLSAARSYINLCSEEYYLHARRRIDSETWRVWSTGMEDVFRLPWLRETWEQVRDEFIVLPGFCALVDRWVQDGSDNLELARKAPVGGA